MNGLRNCNEWRTYEAEYVIKGIADTNLIVNNVPVCEALAQDPTTLGHCQTVLDLAQDFESSGLVEEPNLIKRVVTIYHEIFGVARRLGIKYDRDEPLAPLIQAIKEAREDERLVSFFNCLVTKNVVNARIAGGNRKEQAHHIRQWMDDHAGFLNHATALDLSSLRVSHLSEETPWHRVTSLNLQYSRITTLFVHSLRPRMYVRNCTESVCLAMLVELNLSSTPFRGFAKDYIPQKLKKLFLSHTPMSRFPDVFDPPELEELDLSYSAVVALPPGLKGRKLKSLNLRGTAISAWPQPFSPIKLDYLNVSMIAITRFPPALSNLSTLHIVSTAKYWQVSQGIKFENLTVTFESGELPFTIQHLQPAMQLPNNTMQSVQLGQFANVALTGALENSKQEPDAKRQRKDEEGDD